MFYLNIYRKGNFHFQISFIRERLTTNLTVLLILTFLPLPLSFKLNSHPKIKMDFDMRKGINHYRNFVELATSLSQYLIFVITSHSSPSRSAELPNPKFVPILIFFILFFSMLKSHLFVYYNS